MRKLLIICFVLPLALAGCGPNDSRASCVRSETGDGRPYSVQVDGEGRDYYTCGNPVPAGYVSTGIKNARGEPLYVFQP